MKRLFLTFRLSLIPLPSLIIQFSTPKGCTFFKKIFIIFIFLIIHFDEVGRIISRIPASVLGKSRTSYTFFLFSFLHLILLIQISFYKGQAHLFYYLHINLRLSSHQFLHQKQRESIFTPNSSLLISSSFHNSM